MKNTAQIIAAALLLASACASTGGPDRASMRTLADIRTIAAGVESYAAARREFPRATTVSGLRELLEPEFMRFGSIDDGWGRPFRYVSTDGCRYTISSDGPDGVSGSSDDIRYADNAFVSVPRGAEALYAAHEDRRFSCAE